MGNVDFLAFEEWQKLFEKEGFALLHSEARRINAFQQWKQDLKERQEAQVRGEKWQAWKQFFKMYMTDKSFRAYAKTITPSMKTLRSFFQYLGYTLIIAQKPE